MKRANKGRSVGGVVSSYFAAIGKPAPAMTACQQASATESAPDPDVTSVYLTRAQEQVERAIVWLELACADSRVDASVRRAAMDALRDALTAIEVEVEARNAEA